MENVKKKNLFVFILVICFLCSLFVGLFVIYNNKEDEAVFADTGSESGLRFTLFNDNTEYKVAALNRNLTEAVIPAYYNGLPVTEISDNAFMSCTLLESVKIPYTVLRVGNNAFYNCRSLQSVAGMVHVEEVGNSAFAMCSQLDDLIIPAE